MLLDASLASRAAQADEKGWTGFTKDVNERIKSLVWPKLSDTKAKIVKGDERALKSFFGALASAKGRDNR